MYLRIDVMDYPQAEPTKLIPFPEQVSQPADLWGAIDMFS